jgi:hypothetical protein
MPKNCIGSSDVKNCTKETTRHPGILQNVVIDYQTTLSIIKRPYRLSNDLIDYQTTPLNTDGLTVAEAIGDPQYFPN